MIGTSKRLSPGMLARAALLCLAFASAAVARDDATVGKRGEDEIALQASKIGALQNEGNLAAAQKLLDALPPSAPEELVMGVRLDQLWLQGRLDEVISQCTAFIERSRAETTFYKTRQIGCRLVIANALHLQGKADASVASCKQAMALLNELGLADQQPERPGLRYRANAHACLDEKAAAFADLRQAQDLAKGDARLMPGFELTRARFHVRFGEYDAAIAILKHSLTVPNGSTAARLRLDPDWTALRSDPRFQALLKQAP